MKTLLHDLEFEKGKLVKVDGACPAYMSGRAMINLINSLAEGYREGVDHPQQPKPDGLELGKSYVVRNSEGRYARLTTAKGHGRTSVIDWEEDLDNATLLNAHGCQSLLQLTQHSCTTHEAVKKVTLTTRQERSSA